MEQVGTHQVPTLPRGAAHLLPGLQRAGADDRLALRRGMCRELVWERKVSVCPACPPSSSSLSAPAATLAILTPALSLSGEV